MPRLLSRFSTSVLMGLAFTIPATLIAGGLLYYHLTGAQHYLADEGVRYGQILADQILGASQRFLRLGSVTAVQEMVEDAGSSRPVMHLALVGGDGKVIASNQLAWVGQGDTVISEPAYRAVAAEARASFKAQHRLVDDGKRLVLVAPILAQGSNPILWNARPGVLYLKLDQERELHQIYSAILTRGIVSALGILVISLSLLLWVRAFLARPILAIASYLRQFASGIAGAPPRVAGPQEVAQLVEDLGRMVCDLEEKQSALTASEERHRRLLQGAYDAILTADPESGRILEVNRTFCALFGYSPEEARALTLNDLHPREDRDLRMGEYATVGTAGQRDLHEIPCVRKGGERFLVDIRGGPISIGHRMVAEWIFRDMTERRGLEAQLHQAQKMESVANLAGGIAHDFNNLLTGILGYTRLVLDRLGPSDPNRRQMGIIERSATRAAELTAQLLTFSRRAASRPAPGDLNQVLAAAIDEIRGGMPREIDLEVRRAPDLWTTAVDATQIRQVLLHLYANARDAMPSGGRLSIEIGNRTVSVDDCRGNLEARPGRFVTLVVRDTGTGITPEIRSRLFEPFFTTKKASPAAGLGLATVYGSVKGHDGWVEVESQPGRGSSFVVHLPVLESAAGEAPTAVEPIPVAIEGPAIPLAAHPSVDTQPANRAAGTILAVDDESTVLALARDVLEMHGYQVLTARNGEEALRIYREHAAGVDLVLMDLTMPVMGGLECFRQMRQIDSRVRVVFSSGFSSESTATDVLHEGALDFVQKPYDIDQLAKVVRQALGRTAGVTGTTGLSPN